MMSHRVFKPKKTSQYDLCHFYQVGLSGDLPEFPLPHTPATHEQVSSLLLKARALGWPNLIIVHSQDMVTAIYLLQELHVKDSLCCLPMETKAESGSKPIWKLSFCPFCQYSGSNDPSYMNHIICGHYNASYGCGKWLDEVYIMGQPLHKHMQTCKGLPKEAVDMLPQMVRMVPPLPLRRRRASQRIHCLACSLLPRVPRGACRQAHATANVPRKNPLQHQRSQTPARRRNAPAATSTMENPARTRTSPASFVKPSPVEPARTSRASATGKASLARRSKTASLMQEAHLLHPHT